MRLKPTQWPDALPHPHEEKIFSVVCGNTNIKWAVHEGVGMSFSPSCCWRTELLSVDDVTTDPPTTALARLLPTAAMRIVFGHDDGNMTKQAALESSHRRLATLLTVYIVSTNMDQAEKVAWCFSEIPSRVYCMQPDDFFTADQGRYESMGIDRLACMRAAGEIVGFPALVIDGGTCMTYTACDRKGHIVGGGITLGLQAKLGAIAECTRYAPGMVSVHEKEEMLAYANELVEQNQPLDYFCRNTKEAVVSSALKEMALFCRQVIKNYLNDIQAHGETENRDGLGESGNLYQNNNMRRRPNDAVPKIVLAGGDSRILQNLLKMENNHLLAPFTAIRPYAVAEYKHLIAFGVANAIKAKVEKYKTTTGMKFEKLLLGCRVAKEFSKADDDGDRVYRGTIAGAIRTKNNDLEQYLVVYDDADTEELNLIEIHSALTLYSLTGEKRNKKQSDEVDTVLAEKKRVSQAAAREMEDTNSKVKAQAEAIRMASVAVAAKSPRPMQTNPALKAAPMSDSMKSALPLASASKRKPKVKETTPKTKKVKVPDPASDPQYFVNRRVGKFFENVIYFGIVSGYDTNEELWQIDYDDGDEEEFDKDELAHHLRLYESNKHLDKK